MIPEAGQKEVNKIILELGTVWVQNRVNYFNRGPEKKLEKKNGEKIGSGWCFGEQCGEGLGGLGAQPRQGNNFCRETFQKFGV